jgi:CYTH domain-containing protein
MSFVTVAVTGGPAGGKTTAMKELTKQFGDQVLVMPEVASILLDGGFPKPGRDMVYSPEWAERFQNAVVPTQLSMEACFRDMALQRMARVIVCDRGLLDSAAYLGRGVDGFLTLFGFNLDDIHRRYDLVIHLESVAVKRPDLYERVRHTNNRYESAREAAEVDAAIQTAWARHPNRVVVASHDIKEVTGEVVHFIAQYLREEIERKYVLPAMPAIALPPGEQVVQGYMDTHMEMRWRKMGNNHYFTVKGQASVGGHRRPECERQFDAWAYEQAMAKDVVVQVAKTRWIIPHSGGGRIELDEYQGPLAGLVTLECEFPNEVAMEAFVLPDWAKDAVDVTDDPRYKNRSLAFQGLPVN